MWGRGLRAVLGFLGVAGTMAGAAVAGAGGMGGLLLILKAHGSLAIWLLVAGGALPALGVFAASSRSALAENETQRALEDRRRLEQTASERAALRAPVAPASEVDPTSIGIDAAVQSILRGGQVPLYVPRAVDAELGAAVREAIGDGNRWIVAVVGPSKVGKSRALYEALRRCDQDARLELIAPVDGSAVESLVARAEQATGRVDQPYVLWLDDVEPFVNEGVTLDTLRRWRNTVPRGLVAVTAGGKGSDLVRDAESPTLATLAGEILQYSRQISVGKTTAEEIAPLTSRLPPDVLDSISRHGVAAFVVAGPALEFKLATGRHAAGEPESPEGLAVVHAAVDWARCGRTDSISHQTLRDLWAAYLPPGAQAGEERFLAGVAWARRPVAGTIALLLSAGDYYPYEYVVRLVSFQRQYPAPRREAWGKAIAEASDTEAFSVGVAAVLYGEYDEARLAWIRARQSSVTNVSAGASYNLAHTLETLGRLDEAVEVYEEIVTGGEETLDSARRELVAQAELNLGLLFGRLDRPAEAIVIYRQLIARFREAVSPVLQRQVVTAMVNSGAEMAEQNQHAEAIAAYEEALAEVEGVPEPAVREMVAMALVNKGLALAALDRADDASAIYEEVVTRFGASPNVGQRKQVVKADLIRQVAATVCVPEANHHPLTLTGQVGSSIGMPTISEPLLAPTPPIVVRRAELGTDELDRRLAVSLKQAFADHGAVIS